MYDMNKPNWNVPMRILAVARNLWLLFLNLAKHRLNNSNNSKDSQSVLTMPLAVMVVVPSAILLFVTKLKFQNITGTHAATCSLYYKNS